ncbi:MAG: ABC transporter ATP-binding protein [Thermoleophilia bacterium]
MTPLLEFDRVSKWFRDTVAVGDVSFAIEPGVTGLLGHNGAGKSTAIRLATGLARPDEGSVRVLGLDPRCSGTARAAIGLVPDGDGLWPGLTALGLVVSCARLRGVTNPQEAARRALTTVDLLDVADREVKGFSQDMRQRVKIAQALVHDPQVLILDEPLNGLDPQQRETTIALLRDLGNQGIATLFSSHVLSEVERVADRVLVLVNGRLVAEGSPQGLRELMDERPRRVQVATTNARAVAAGLAGLLGVESVEISDEGVLVETRDPTALALALPELAVATNAQLRSIEPTDEDLESIYGYLTERARGARR